MIKAFNKIIIISFLFCQFYSFKLTEILNETDLVIPLINEYKDKLYLISSNEKKNVIMNAYNSKSLTKNEYPALNQANAIDAAFGGEDSEYLLVFYGNILNIYKENELLNATFNNTYDILTGTFKKIGSSYFYISSNYEIKKFELDLANLNNSVKKSIYFSESIKNINSISCDYSRDEKYYICSYFYDTNNFGISVFSNELNLLNNYKYDTNVLNSSDYFNKIVYLKDKNKFVSINSESDSFIRLRYLQIDSNGKLKNILNIKKAKNYIDINGTQANPYIYYNDIVSLESDKIIKIYTEESKHILFSKIQFFNDDTVLTVKTMTISYDRITSFINPKLIIWRNSLIVTIGNKEANDKNYKESFFSLGYPDANEDLMITENEDFIGRKPKMDLNFFALKLYYKVLNIPEGFQFINAINNKEIKEGTYLDPETDKISIKKYQKSVNASLKYQVVSMGQFYNLTYEIFPKGEKSPSEINLISRGDYGQFIILIDFCNNGFYDVEKENEDDEMEMCSKIKPEGYYLYKEDYKYIYKKCHPYCAECITGSSDDSNMECLSCKKYYYYDSETFNCYPIYPENNKVSLKAKLNGFFWVFLLIFIFAISLTAFLIWNDKIIKPKLNNNNIEEQQSLIGEINSVGSKEMN